MTTPELSVVVPCHNEAENLRPLLAAIHSALDPLGLDYEVVITDDYSSDDSWRVLQGLGARNVSNPIVASRQRAGLECKSHAAVTSQRSMPICKMIPKICRR